MQFSIWYWTRYNYSSKLYLDNALAFLLWLYYRIAPQRTPGLTRRILQCSRVFKWRRRKDQATGSRRTWSDDQPKKVAQGCFHLSISGCLLVSSRQTPILGWWQIDNLHMELFTTTKGAHLPLAGSPRQDLHFASADRCCHHRWLTSYRFTSHVKHKINNIYIKMYIFNFNRLVND